MTEPMDKQPYIQMNETPPQVQLPDDGAINGLQRELARLAINSKESKRTLNLAVHNRA